VVGWPTFSSSQPCLAHHALNGLLERQRIAHIITQVDRSVWFCVCFVLFLRFCLFCCFSSALPVLTHKNVDRLHHKALWEHEAGTRHATRAPGQCRDHRLTELHGTIYEAMCVACLAVEYVSGIDGERQFLVCL
jgi:NAD-dependent SIR2 family protein deacetylase